MESLIFNLFGRLFKFVGVLIVGGVMVFALMDIQKRAFDSKSTGLISMLRVNQQLVGKESLVTGEKTANTKK